MSKKRSVNKDCSVCGNSLQDYHTTAKICHKASCAKERNRRKANTFGRLVLWGKPKVCPVCTKTFNCSKAHKKFCSKACANYKEKP